MSRRLKVRDHATFIQLVLSAAFVYTSIYLWKLTGCLGYSHCFLCQPPSPESFLNELRYNSSTHDLSRLMNLNNFTFLINNLVCQKTHPLLLVLVHSAPYNEEKRTTIRTTWGQIIDENFKLLFLLGQPNSTTIQKRLKKENETNGDLVQGNFLDTYRNLTYKHVMGLKWTKYFCPGAKYLLKTDDDVFVNSPSFLFYVKLHVPQSNVMRCLPMYHGRAERSWRSKWRVKFSEYQFRTYPAYCQGFAILYSLDVVSLLYAKAQGGNYFWIDDVFVTGIVGSAVNITPSSFGDLLLKHKEFYELLEEDSGNFPYLLGPWNLEIEFIRKLWEWIPKYGFNLPTIKKPLDQRSW